MIPRRGQLERVHFCERGGRNKRVETVLLVLSHQWSTLLFLEMLFSPGAEEKVSPTTTVTSDIEAVGGIHKN